MNLADLINDKLNGKRAVILGVGSELKSDDRVGMYIAKKLSQKLSNDNILILEGSTAPENMTGVIKEFAPDSLFIIDAAYMGLEPGGIKIIEDDEIDGMSFSTHMLPLSVMLNYLKLHTGCEVICIGIQPICTDFGEEMHRSIHKSADELIDIFCK